MPETPRCLSRREASGIGAGERVEVSSAEEVTSEQKAAAKCTGCGVGQSELDKVVIVILVVRRDKPR